MPRYRVRLEDPDSDEFRVTVLTAKDKKEARTLCERREQRLVETTYSEQELNDADERGNRGPRRIHEQAKPYKVVAIAKRGEKFEAVS